MNVFAKGVPGNCFHTSYRQKQYKFVDQTKPCPANIVPEDEKFWPSL